MNRRLQYLAGLIREEEQEFEFNPAEEDETPKKLATKIRTDITKVLNEYYQKSKNDPSDVYMLEFIVSGRGEEEEETIGSGTMQEVIEMLIKGYVDSYTDAVRRDDEMREYFDDSYWVEVDDTLDFSEYISIILVFGEESYYKISSVKDFEENIGDEWEEGEDW